MYRRKSPHLGLVLLLLVPLTLGGLVFAVSATENASTTQQAEATPSEAPVEPAVLGAGSSEAPHEERQESVQRASHAWITNDAVVLGLLTAILGGVFWTSRLTGPFWKTFYTFIPMLLLCYFLPSLLTVTGMVDPEQSQLYFMATRYLLPASLILLTLSIDLREVLRLGPKALIMFLVGTLGVVLGGPVAILIVKSFWPSLVGGTGDQAVWRGLATVAGSWIGGGANQAAMKEIFLPSDALYSTMVAVDVLVAEFWMMFLLLGVGKADAIDRWLRADSSSVDRLRNKMEEFGRRTARIATSTDLMIILALAFGFTALSHACADWLAPWFGTHYPNLNRLSLNSQFFWLIVLATTFGVGLSFTSARQLEGVGASKIGTVFIFILVATIGLKMDIRAVAEHPGLFLVGVIWMAFHVGLLFAAAYLMRAPFFFLAVGSKANIGGAASAPVVAAAFHPSLAPVGVLLAVVGYALGTYGAWLCANMMDRVSP